MTDDSDNDERMDRARRIREMRESVGGDADETADDTDAGDADDTDAGADADDTTADTADDGGAESDSGAEESEDDATTPEETDDADAAEEDSDEAASEESDAGEGDDGDGDDEGLHVPGADVGDVEVDVEEMAEQAGIEASDEDAEEVAAGPAGVDTEVESTTKEETRVLEFALGDEVYCLDIQYIEEIIKRESVTRVPNTPEFVSGVVDIRGQITTIIDPKIPLEIENGDSDEQLIIVFDTEAIDEQGAVGWLVDDVRQVSPIVEEEVNEAPVERDHVNGVVDRDGEFVVWTTPEVALDEASS